MVELKGVKKVIEKVYLNNLKDIQNNYTKNSGVTYLDQLDQIGRKIFGNKFRGVFPSDKIPKLNGIKRYCILNLDKSDEPGSHWVALAKLQDGETIFYDSFGRCHTKIIPNLNLSGNGRIINSEKDREQTTVEENCGQRCLAFLMIVDRYDRLARFV
jgi:hypothetical protein